MQLWDFFPNLFESEKAGWEEAESERQLAEYKAKMIDFAYKHNAQRKRKEVD